MEEDAYEFLVRPSGTGGPPGPDDREEMIANAQVGDAVWLCLRDITAVTEWVSRLQRFLARPLPKTIDYSVQLPPKPVADPSARRPIPFSAKYEPVVEAARLANDLLECYRAFLNEHQRYNDAAAKLVVASKSLQQYIEASPKVRRVIRRSRRPFHLQLAFPNAARRANNRPFLDLNEMEVVMSNSGTRAMGDDYIQEQSEADRRVNKWREVLRQVQSNRLLDALVALF